MGKVSAVATITLMMQKGDRKPQKQTKGSIQGTSIRVPLIRYEVLNETCCQAMKKKKGLSICGGLHWSQDFCDTAQIPSVFLVVVTQHMTYTCATSYFASRLSYHFMKHQFFYIPLSWPAGHWQKHTKKLFQPFSPPYTDQVSSRTAVTPIEYA